MKGTELRSGEDFWCTEQPRCFPCLYCRAGVTFARPTPQTLLTSFKKLIMSVYNAQAALEPLGEGEEAVPPPIGSTPENGRPPGRTAATMPPLCAICDGKGCDSCNLSSVRASAPSESAQTKASASAAPFPSTLVPIYAFRLEDALMHDRWEVMFDLSLTVEDNAALIAATLYGPPPGRTRDLAAGAFVSALLLLFHLLTSRLHEI